MNISKKELNDLVDELFSNLSDVDFDEVDKTKISLVQFNSLLCSQINKYDLYPELFRTKQRPNRSDNNQEPSRSVAQSDNDTTFQPSAISTPTSTKNKSMGNTQTAATDTVNESTISVLTNLSTNDQSTLLGSENQTPTLVPVNVVNPFHGAKFVNGVIQVPQHQQILIQIPTIDILKVQAQQQQQHQHQECEIITSSVDSLFRPGSSTGKSSLYQQRLFRHLKSDSPVTEVSCFRICFDIFQQFPNHFNASADI